MAPSADVNIDSPGVKATPYPFYARPHAEAPIHRMALPGKQNGWLKECCEDVAPVLNDDRLVKD